MVFYRNILPEEFSSIINTDKSYSLLIKGLPGTGKSSLALEIVARMTNSFSEIFSLNLILMKYNSDAMK